MQKDVFQLAEEVGSTLTPRINSSRCGTRRRGQGTSDGEGSFRVARALVRLQREGTCGIRGEDARGAAH